MSSRERSIPGYPVVLTFLHLSRLEALPDGVRLWSKNGLKGRKESARKGILRHEQRIVCPMIKNTTNHFDRLNNQKYHVGEIVTGVMRFF